MQSSACFSGPKAGASPCCLGQNKTETMGSGLNRLYISCGLWQDGWSGQQMRLYSRMLKVLHLDRLARSVICSLPVRAQCCGSGSVQGV
jgi:hypothetical protein